MNSGANSILKWHVDPATYKHLPHQLQSGRAMMTKYRCRYLGCVRNMQQVGKKTETSRDPEHERWKHPEIIEYEVNLEEDRNIRKCPNMKVRSMRRTWRAKRLGKKIRKHPVMSQNVPILAPSWPPCSSWKCRSRLLGNFLEYLPLRYVVMVLASWVGLKSCAALRRSGWCVLPFSFTLRSRAGGFLTL